MSVVLCCVCVHVLFAFGMGKDVVMERFPNSSLACIMSYALVFFFFELFGGGRGQGPIVTQEASNPLPFPLCSTLLSKHVYPQPVLVLMAFGLDTNSLTTMKSREGCMVVILDQRMERRNRGVVGNKPMP